MAKAPPGTKSNSMPSIGDVWLVPIPVVAVASGVYVGDAVAVGSSVAVFVRVGGIAGVNVAGIAVRVGVGAGSNHPSRGAINSAATIKINIPNATHSQTRSFFFGAFTGVVLLKGSGGGVFSPGCREERIVAWLDWSGRFSPFPDASRSGLNSFAPQLKQNTASSLFGFPHL
jgi:hypothetical protein